jgi:hypothetical protein
VEWVQPVISEAQPEAEEIWTLEPVEEQGTPDQLWTLEVAEAYVEETWTAETDEPPAAEDPWVVPAEHATGADEEGWGAAPTEPEAQTEPWTFATAEPLPEESIWTLEPALEVIADSWADQVPEITVEPPLATFPGEAEAWEAVAAPVSHEPAPEAPPAAESVDRRYTRMADLLESFAAELRAHGADAFARALDKDRLSAALAGFVAGFEAASHQD